MAQLNKVVKLENILCHKRLEMSLSHGVSYESKAEEAFLQTGHSESDGCRLVFTRAPVTLVCLWVSHSNTAVIPVMCPLCSFSSWVLTHWLPLFLQIWTSWLFGLMAISTGKKDKEQHVRRMEVKITKQARPVYGIRQIASWTTV